jgi:O-antigen ligase
MRDTARPVPSGSRVYLPQVAAGAAGFGLLLALGLGGAAWLPRSWRLSTLGFAALAGAALVARRQISFSRLEWTFLGGLAALTLWTAVSASWSGRAAISFLEAERTLVYVVGVGALFLVVSRRAIYPLLVGAATGITAVTVYGLVDYLHAGRPLMPIMGRLLFEPIGYANGFGIFAAIGFAIVAVLGVTTRSWWVRAAAAAAAGVLATAIYYTESRGSMLALAGGLAIAFVFSRAGLRTRGAVLALVAAAIVVTSAVATASHVFDRTELVGENRPKYWRVAWKEYELNPIVGSGAGTYYAYWLRYREVESFTRVAHNLYLEELAELGPLALALVVGTLALPLLAAKPGVGSHVTAAVAGYATFVLHVAVDWDWEQPGITLAGLLCGGAILVATRPERAPGLSLRARALLASAAIACALLALIRLETGPDLPFGT